MIGEVTKIIIKKSTALSKWIHVHLKWRIQMNCDEKTHVVSEDYGKKYLFRKIYSYYCLMLVNIILCNV